MRVDYDARRASADFARQLREMSNFLRIPAWLIDQSRTPRRTKRPLPAHKPYKPRAHRRAAY